MYQSMSFLQMGAEELDECLSELCTENPMLERQPPKEQPGRGMICNLYGRTRSRGGDFTELPIPDKCRYTLRDALTDQVMAMRLPSPVRRALELMILNLDGRGYLPEPELLRSAIGDDGVFHDAYALLRSLEPAGVGATGLSDCLQLQLEQQGERDSLAYRICGSYLEHLAKNHYNHISRVLGVSEAEIVEAKKLIASLQPIPANGYDEVREPLWIVPDIEVVCEDGELCVRSCERLMPSYAIDTDYERMGEQNELSEADRAYFREKLSEAQWALNCVSRRRDTLLRCAYEIIEEQRDFFEDGTSPIHPCSMAAIAARMGVHPSTVSRTVKDKYILCERGILPMAGFFAQEVCGETAEELTRQIRQIIGREDPEKPLSDSAICKKLNAKGYGIARRTVAKYREQAMIPSATGRKKRKNL